MLAGEAFSPIQRPNSELYLQIRSVVQRLMPSSESYIPARGAYFHGLCLIPQHEILDFLSPDIHRLLPFVPITFHFPHQEIRFQLLILLRHRIIMDGYEAQRRLLPMIQINYQLCSSNRKWRSLGKAPGCVAHPTPPWLQVCILFLFCLVFVNGGCLVIRDMCSSNPYNSVVADDKNHWPLKCACKDGITAGCPLPWNRMRVEGGTK